MEFESYRDLVMFYQTTVRNVALTTAVSFAALGYSRFYRGKSKLYSSGLVLVSLLLLSCSFLLNYHLFNSIQPYLNKEKYTSINQWKLINKLFMVIHAMLFFFALYTFYRLYTNNTF